MGEIRYPCHIYEIKDGREARHDLVGSELVKKYNTDTLQIDTKKLEECLKVSYVAPFAIRKLIQCQKCGALLVYQCICDPNIYEGFEWLEDWIPVHSEEEADQINNTLDAVDLSMYPIRHLQKEDRTPKWTEGENPRLYDPEEMQKDCKSAT